MATKKKAKKVAKGTKPVKRAPKRSAKKAKARAKAPKRAPETNIESDIARDSVESVARAEDAAALKKPFDLSPMTEDEEKRLRACWTTEEYNFEAQSIKRSRGDAYPSDWFAKVMSDGGIYSIIRERAGKTNEPAITLMGGDGAVLATLPGPKPPEPA